MTTCAARQPLATRTSRTDPLRIDELVPVAGAGRIGICLCPGKQAPSLTGPAWARDLASDLDTIERWRADHVLTLLEDHEFDELAVPQLGLRIRARGIRWQHLPIADYCPPDARFEAAWMQRGPDLLAQLRGGARVLVHCRGGLGRAGTVAARMLVELGAAPADAIAQVRSVRPGSIETRAQVGYILALRQAVQTCAMLPQRA
jgi:ADP-ribosyl-[dinitrogen reductase] hydrolase